MCFCVLLRLLQCVIEVRHICIPSGQIRFSVSEYFSVFQCVAVRVAVCALRYDTYVCLVSRSVSVFQCVSVCFSVFQCVPVCCSARCSVLLRYDIYVCLVNSSVSLFSCVFVCCRVFSWVAVCFSVL